MQKPEIKILLVDDDQIDRMAIQRYARDHELPYDIHIAKSLADAREKLQQHQFDVILLDFNLGDGTGLDILPEIKETPVTFITGSGDESIAVQAMRHGAYDYLIKDLDRNYLTVLPETLNNVLNRKQSEEALRESEARYRRLVEFSPDLIAVHQSGGIVYINPAGARLLGASDETGSEIIGKSIVDFIHPDDRQTVADQLQPVQDDGGKVELIETKITPLYGESIIDVEASAIPISYQRKPATQVVIRNITERKRVMLELREAKERAEAATKLKDKFVSLVSHDLRAPFTSLLGLLQSLYDDTGHPLDVKQKDILNRAMGSSESMINMIEELLNISRLQTGEIIPEPVFVNAYFTVAAAIGSFSHLAQKKGIELVNEVPQGVRLYADLILFVGVLKNLISNSIKFCNTGDRIAVLLPAGQESAIAVKDTGVGISAKNLPNLFRQEVKTTTRGTAGEKGTGLGLPYCYGIMETLGGTLRVESTEGEGSIFYAELPFVKPRILLVDHDESARASLRKYLDSLQLDILEAKSGEEAIAMVAESPPNLIISDTILPGLDGMELIERLKSQRETKAIPIIVTTADNQIETREKALRVGAIDFISKPVVNEDLIPRVRKVVG